MGSFIIILSLLFAACVRSSEFNYEIALHVGTVVKDFLNEVAYSMNVISGNIYTKNAPALQTVGFSKSQMFAYMRVYYNRSGVNSLYVALDSDGAFSAYGFDSFSPFQLVYHVTDTSFYYHDKNLHMYYFDVDGNGEPLDYFHNMSGHFNKTYDPRKRPWYIPVAQSHSKMWSPPYIDTFSGYPTVTLVYPIMNVTYLGGGDEFIGTLAADLLVTSVNTFLTKTYQDTNKMVFVVDRATGYLLGNSFGEPNYSVAGSGKKALLLAVNSTNSIIAGATKLMIAQNWTKHLIMYTDYYVQAVEYNDPIQGLNWNVVILMPAVKYPDAVLPPSGYYYAIILIATTTLVANVIALSSLICFWKTRTIQLTQPIFTLMVLAGGIVLSVLCFLLVGENTAALCFLRPFLFNLTFTWIIATLLIKGWAVHAKFNSMPFEEFEKTELIHVIKLLVLLAGFVLVDLLLMCVFLYAIGGPNGKGTKDVTRTVEGENGAFASVTSCAFVANSGLRSAEIAYKTVLIFFSCLYGYLNRRIPGLIAGSRQLVILVYNVALTSMVVVVVTDTFTEVDLIVFAQVIGICFCVCVNSGLLVLPSIYMVYSVGDARAVGDVQKTLKKGHALSRLKSLPIHYAIVERYHKDLILEALHHHQDTVFERIENETAMQLALTYGVDAEVMMVLAQLFLPYTDDLQPIDASVHGFGWAQLTQSDVYVEVVRKIVKDYSRMCFLLADTVDGSGRVVINIASPSCREIISKATYFRQRYQLTTSLSAPHYKSATTMVHMAIDHGSDNKDNVVLKFMVNKCDFEREVKTRQHCSFDPQFVIELNEVIDCDASDQDSELDEEFVKHGFSDYRHCLVMPAGNRNLAEVLASETSSDKKKDFVRFSAIQLMKALSHMHEHGYIHGDVKPQNIVRIRDSWTIVDLDAASAIGTEVSGLKLRSAYAPPELIYIDDFGKAVVKAANSAPGSLSIVEYDLVRAQPSHDCWALGTVLFRMASGEPLFLANNSDEIDNAQLTYLAEEDSDWMASKLDKIDDLMARNMVSQMLIFDPTKRPSFDQLMMHPFLTGSHTARLLGQEAEYDVFISYRVASDAHHAELLFNKLTGLGLKPWWDKKCLKAGEDWESGFCDGLVNSKVFVALLSKDAVNHPDRANQCFAKMVATSACDNVYLEHRLALCLNKRGLLAKVYPLMIGEIDPSTSNYCHYHFPDLSTVKSVVVASVEKKLRDHLARECLGTPLMPNLSVKDAMDALTRNQGHFIVGEKEATFNEAAQSILEMVHAAKAEHTGKTSHRHLSGAESSRQRSYESPYAGGRLNVQEGALSSATMEAGRLVVKRTVVVQPITRKHKTSKKPQNVKLAFSNLAAQSGDSSLPSARSSDTSRQVGSEISTNGMTRGPTPSTTHVIVSDSNTSRSQSSSQVESTSSSPRDYREVYDVETGRFVWLLANTDSSLSVCKAGQAEAAGYVGRHAISKTLLEDNLNESF